MNPAADENRASVLTPPGRGAVAVVAAAGPATTPIVDAHFRAANGRPLSDQPLGRILFGHWHAGDDHREEVVVTRCGDMQLEIHCHGGVAAAERILAALADGGCHIQTWQEWIEVQSADAIEFEADVALAAATTLRTAAILLDQRQGALGRAIEAARHDISTGQLPAARESLAALLARAPLGLHLTQPWHVAIAGRPNVGKSSLINALVGYQRAIVFDQHGTTRDVLTAETAIDGWPVQLTDAAGIRDAAEPLEAEGVARAVQRIENADLVIWVRDATVTDDRRHVCPAAPLDVMNKIDLVSFRPAEDVLSVSALTGEGLDELLSAIANRLVPNPPLPGEAIPFNPRQVELLTQAANRLDAGDKASAIAALARIPLKSPTKNLQKNAKIAKN